MTIPETIQSNKDNSIEQDKVDTNLNQKTNDTNPNQQPPAAETQEDPNWRAFREARKKDRAEREAAEKRAAEKEAEAAALKAAMEAAFNRMNPVIPSQNEYEQEEETEDQRIEKKVQAILSARELQAQKMREEQEQKEYPDRLNKTYPDFNHTISQENLDYLDYHYPEVSRPLQRLKNGFDKWSDIYLAIKKFVPNHANAKKDAMRADMNQNKPKSISSTGLTQGDHIPSTRLSEDRKAANWERMQRLLKGVN